MMRSNDESSEGQGVPVEPTDDELLQELKRIRSDLGFRKWISLRVRIVLALVVFDLAVSVLSVTAVGIALNAQHSSCVRDNNLRAAYTAQWQPILDDAKAKNDPAQAGLVHRFEVGLDGFKQHGCGSVNLVAVAVAIFAGLAVISIVIYRLIRWFVVKRRPKGGSNPW